MKQYKILVVEDDEVDRMNILRAFKKSNFLNEVDICHDGIEAIEYLESADKEVPILILLDINMPRMNGLEFLEKIRQDPYWKATPVVMLTTSQESNDLVAAYNANVAGYLLKPVEFSNFIETMIAIKQYWSLVQFPNS